MTNRYGLDVRYYREKLSQLIRDADNYTPEEMSRALFRLAGACLPRGHQYPQEVSALQCLLAEEGERMLGMVQELSALKNHNQKLINRLMKLRRMRHEQPHHTVQKPR